MWVQKELPVNKSTLNLHEWTHSSTNTLAQIESVCMFKGILICLVYEMLYIKQLRPPLNLQTDSIHAKVFV